MRNALLPLVIASAVLVVGCQRRDNAMVVPERYNHAYASEGVKQNTYVGPVANPASEEYYKLQAGESLYTVAKKFNTTAKWLIERNEISNVEEIKPGKTLIVPLAK